MRLVDFGNLITVNADSLLPDRPQLFEHAAAQVSSCDDAAAADDDDNDNDGLVMLKLDVRQQNRIYSDIM